MDELEKWDLTLKTLERWIAGLDMGKILDVSEIVEKALDYQAKRIDNFWERDSFIKFMNGQFK